jgi:hypothetical protein
MGRHSFKFTYPAWAPISHTLFAIARLSLLVHPDWDLAWVRTTLDLSSVLGALIPAFQRIRVSNAALLERIVLRFKNFRDVFEKRRAEVLGESLRSGSLATAAAAADRAERESLVVVAGPETAVVPPESGLQSLYGDVQMDGILMDGMLKDDFGPLGDDSFWQEMMGDWPTFRSEIYL